MESQFVNEAVLEGLIGTFYSAFRLRFELDAKLQAGVIKLSENIFAVVFHCRRAVIKDGTVVGLELRRDAVIAKNLIEDVKIAGECFLPIKEGADNRAGSIIDSQVKRRFPIAEPEMKRAVHLDFFPEVFTALLARVSVFERDLATDDRIRFTFGNGRVSRQQFSFSEFMRNDTFLTYRNPPAADHNKLTFIMTCCKTFPKIFL